MNFGVKVNVTIKVNIALCIYAIAKLVEVFMT